MTKRDLIVLALERRDEFTAPGSTGDLHGGERLPILPHDKGCLLHREGTRCSCWRRTFDELDRCLRLLRELRPGQYAHLNARYLQAVTVHRRVWFRHGRWQGLGPSEQVLGYDMRGRGTPASREYEVLVQVWPGWVRRRKVEGGLEWLVETFRGEPYLPDEVLAA